MPKRTRGAINPVPATSVSLASTAAATIAPNQPFRLMLGDQAAVLAHTLDFLSAQDATAISLSSQSLNGAVKSTSFNALWKQHIQRDYPGLVTQQPSQQAYYQTARLYQDQALSFLLLSSHKIKDYDYSPIKQAANDFKTSTLKQRADYLSQWNHDLGLHQLKNANHKDVQLQGLTELTPAVMQRLTAINQHTPIMVLSITNCYLPQLPKALINFLKACPQLQELYLSHNQLQSLPKILLQTCIQLQWLNLDNNQLQSLPKILLQACPQLERLNLDNNQLQSLPKILLQTCAQLRGLNLNNNQLQSLPETLLQTCIQLQVLNLSHNKLQSLPETLLQACAQLQGLDLSHNQLQSLPETLFQTCTQLEFFDLIHNQLQSLPKNLLQACTQLQWLSLSFNQLQSLPKNLLQACTQLQWVLLDNNQLQSLAETLLQTCTQLEVLDLNNNQLQSLAGILLQHCTKLESLNLSHNHLITVTQNNFSHLSKTSVLNIKDQTPVGTSSSSAIRTEQKIAENEDEPPQKKMRPNR